MALEPESLTALPQSCTSGSSSKFSLDYILRIQDTIVWIVSILKDIIFWGITPWCLIEVFEYQLVGE
jgi:hypothetical protein